MLEILHHLTYIFDLRFHAVDLVFQYSLSLPTLLDIGEVPFLFSREPFLVTHEALNLQEEFLLLFQQSIQLLLKSMNILVVPFLSFVRILHFSLLLKQRQLHVLQLLSRSYLFLLILRFFQLQLPQLLLQRLVLRCSCGELIIQFGHVPFLLLVILNQTTDEITGRFDE